MHFHKVLAAIDTTLFREEYPRFCHIPFVDIMIVREYLISHDTFLDTCCSYLVPCWIRYVHQAKKHHRSCVHIKWLSVYRCVYHSFFSTSLLVETGHILYSLFYKIEVLKLDYVDFPIRNGVPPNDLDIPTWSKKLKLDEEHKARFKYRWGENVVIY